MAPDRQARSPGAGPAGHVYNHGFVMLELNDEKGAAKASYCQASQPRLRSILL